MLELLIQLCVQLFHYEITFQTFRSFCLDFWYCFISTQRLYLSINDSIINVFLVIILIILTPFE